MNYLVNKIGLFALLALLSFHSIAQNARDDLHVTGEITGEGKSSNSYDPTYKDNAKGYFVKLTVLNNSQVEKHSG